MFKRISGKQKPEYYPKTASTVMKNGNLVSLSSGKLIAATSTSLLHAGVILRDCLTTDSDYASATIVPVDAPGGDDIFEADVKVGVTLATTDVGIRCDIYVDATTKEMYIDSGTTTKKQVTIVGYVSASKALVKINSMTNFADAA